MHCDTLYRWTPRPPNRATPRSGPGSWPRIERKRTWRRNTAREQTKRVAVRDVEESMTIDPTELEDFRATLTAQGYSENDFAIRAVENPISDKGISIVTGRVTITYNKTKKSRTYSCGHGSAWVVDFHDDLKAGLYL
jgi:hypothetical protein